MKTPFEMMFGNVLPLMLRHLGMDGAEVQKQIDGVRNTVSAIGRAAFAIYGGVVMANRRLARIEAHLGLSDIEPVPEEIKAIINEHGNEDGAQLPSVLDPGAGAR